MRRATKKTEARRTTSALLGKTDILRLAAETFHDPRSVVAAIEGKPVRESVRRRVLEAMDRLGIRTRDP